MAHTRMRDLHEHLTSTRRRYIDLDNLKGLTRLESNCGP
ncbi:hypothetical protein SXCC_01927 [Gluconacetobacter sp. SXCC-1]|nr:hypothetical protein SXCC_01927 [Gluconacetobacter sp. SXCC-1]